jgi:elongation factor 1 alpha-like protein
MHRVKNVQYNDDDLYDDEEADYDQAEDTYTDEDRNNFATLTPVVRAELEEAGLQASDREIEDALWNYYWDVGRSVTYLKNSRKPKTQADAGKKQQKVKSKFDQAAEKSAKEAGESDISYIACYRAAAGLNIWSSKGRRGGSVYQQSVEIELINLPAEVYAMPSATDWFGNTPWVPRNELIPLVASSQAHRPRLLGGSSKLAKLAEERKKKAATAAASVPGSSTNGSLSSLDRLTKPKAGKENETPLTQSEPRKYPIRKRREPTPPPREPTPAPVEPEEDVPDLRASPSTFGRTLSTSLPHENRPALSMRDMLGCEPSDDPFKGPSPDDAVQRAQQHSKGLAK